MNSSSLEAFSEKNPDFFLHNGKNLDQLALLQDRQQPCYLLHYVLWGPLIVYASCLDQGQTVGEHSLAWFLQFAFQQKVFSQGTSLILSEAEVC